MHATMKAGVPVTLSRLTAEDLMTPNPVSLRDTLTVREALGVLLDKGISGAPVIDEGGRPIGVFSQTDILYHDREAVEHVSPSEAGTGHMLDRLDWDEFQIERADGTVVRDLMTPAVFAVPPTAPARRVIEDMCRLSVHRLFVVDAGGILVGVITALDVLRRLAPEV